MYDKPNAEHAGTGGSAENRHVADARPIAPTTPAPAPAPAAPQTPAAAALVVPPAPPAKKKGGVKRVLLPLLLLAAIGGGGWYGHYYWTEGRFFVSTDDAYVGADMSVASPKITGYVASVPVVENQSVKAGDPLVEIDAGDYQLALDQAAAKIATQHASIERIASQRMAALASVRQAEAQRQAVATQLAQAELDLSRASNLSRTGAGTKAQQDTAQSARDAAAAQVAGADAAIAAAQANVGVFDAQKTEAEKVLGELEVARQVAERNLSFTTLRAPYDGVVGNLAVQPGNLVSPGQRLAAIVPADKVYVDANFKETQLGEIAPGQKVDLSIDALPGRHIEGTVESVSPASGSVFSLLPSDNATGNFTKVVQRVPVRIAIDGREALAGHLRPGLSAVVDVDIRTTPGAATAENQPERAAAAR